MIKLKNILKEMEVLNYYDIGHDNNSYLWWWRNSDEHFEVHSVKNLPSHPCAADFQGRYDPEKNMISIVDMSSYARKLNKTDLKNVPINLLRRLNFEFGDTAQMKTFF
jgi:hypothetical protein